MEPTVPQRFELLIMATLKKRQGQLDNANSVIGGDNEFKKTSTNTRGECGALKQDGQR